MRPDLTAARLALAQLIESGANHDVVAAGRHAVMSAELGLPIPADIQAVLLKHTSKQNTQDRYGK